MVHLSEPEARFARDSTKEAAKRAVGRRTAISEFVAGAAAKVCLQLHLAPSAGKKPKLLRRWVETKQLLTFSSKTSRMLS